MAQITIKYNDSERMDYYVRYPVARAIETLLRAEPAKNECPICGQKTAEGKAGGKICFDCVNKKRGKNGHNI